MYIEVTRVAVSVGRPAVRSSTLIGMLSVVLSIALVDPDGFSPLLPIPTLLHQNGSSRLLVTPAMYFALSASANRSSVLQAAVLRYEMIIFAWGRNMSIPGTGLSRVEVEVDSTDDRAASLQLGVDESYELSVPIGAAAILRAPTVWGALRGLETLSQLIEYDEHSNAYVIRMAPWKVKDRPTFPHRGVMYATPSLQRPLGCVQLPTCASDERQDRYSTSFPASAHAAAPDRRARILQDEHAALARRRRGLLSTATRRLPCASRTGRLQSACHV